MYDTDGRLTSKSLIRIRFLRISGQRLCCKNFRITVLTRTKTKLTHTFRFVKNDCPAQSVFTKTKKKQKQHARFCRILQFRHNSQCKQKSILSITTVSSYTNNVTIGEGRSASTQPSKGSASHCSDIYLQ